MYKLINDLQGKPYAVFKPNEDGTGGTGIPMNETIQEYQEYLRWLAEGNVPTPAEENT
jgi:hypothetical protein